jgi:uncharacterized protein (UPF0276 family)
MDQRPASVGWVEVISENFMPWKERPLGKSFQTLSKIREDLPVALHGVSLNLGSADPLDFDYLSRLKTLIDAIDPFVVSDHLSWTGVNGNNMHDLLPLPYTDEALRFVAQKLDQVQNFLGRPILIENPSSYLEFIQSEMSEPEFITQLLSHTECGLLLDINNVYVSSVNHGFDPKVYLRSIPCEKIGQIHLAGHSQRDGYLIDTHDAPICGDVWALFDWFTSQYGLTNTMIERDGNIPEWQELEKEILRVGEIHEHHKLAR